MSEEITEEVFTHLVELAALEIDPKNGAYLRRELNNQLKAIHDLEAIPLQGETEINLHGITYTPEISMPIRQDEWILYENPEDIITQAPESEDGYIIVPDIPHEELE